MDDAIGLDDYALLRAACRAWHAAQLGGGQVVNSACVCGHGNQPGHGDATPCRALRRLRDAMKIGVR